MKYIVFAFMFVVLSSFVVAQECKLDPDSKSLDAFLAEIPSIDATLQQCPVVLEGAVASLIGNSGTVNVEISRSDGSTTNFYMVVQNKRVTRLSTSFADYKFVVRATEDGINAMLTSKDNFETFKELYRNKDIRISGNGFFSSLKMVVVKPVLFFMTRE